MLLLLLLVSLALSKWQQNQLDLTYFDGRGRAEQIRLFFADQQVVYNDVRLTGAQFEARKKSFPFGHVPVLNMTVGWYLADTAAIAVWNGKQSELWPMDANEEELLLAYSGASEDLRLQKNDVLGTDTDPVPPDVQTKFLPILQEWLFYFERSMANGPQVGAGPFLLGDLFTPVDCRVWDILDQIYDNLDQHHDVYDAYPHTLAFRNGVAARPNIAAYLRTRK